MFHFHHESKGSVYGALIDISSGSVGIAIVASEHSKPLPEIIFARRIEMRVSKQILHEHESLRRVREALFSACLTLSQEGVQALTVLDNRAKITKLFVTCSSPWAYTIARNVRYENDEPFKISTALIEDLAQSAEEEIVSLLHTKPELTERDFAIVERASVDITVNDYPIVNPDHLKGTALALSHIAGLMPKDIIDAIQEVQDKLFPNTELRAHTYMLVMYCVMRDIFPKQHSVCIIDVTSEATEFGIVENNLLIENTYIPYGTSSFMRDASEASGNPISDIKTRISSHKEENALFTTEFEMQIEAYESKISDEIDNILNHRALPTDIIITTQKPFDALFKEIIEKVLKRKSIHALTIITLDSDVIDEVSHGVSNDIYLEIGARFFHKLHGCGEIESH